MHQSVSMMTLPIFAAESPAATAPPGSHDAPTGAESFSNLLQQVDTAEPKTKAASALGRSAQQGTVRDEMHSTENGGMEIATQSANQGTEQIANQIAARIAKTASKTASGDSNVSSRKGGGVEKSSTASRKTATKFTATKAAKNRASQSTAANNGAAPVATPVVTGIVLTPPHTALDTAALHAERGGISPSTARSTAQTPATPSQETATVAESSESFVSIAAARKAALPGAHLTNSSPDANMVAAPLPQKAAAPETPAVARAKLTPLAVTQHSEIAAKSSANAVAAASGDTSQSSRLPVYPPPLQTERAESKPLSTDSAAQPNRETHAASLRTRNEAAQPDASTSRGSSTNSTNGRESAANLATATEGAVHASSLQSSAPPALSQSNAASGQAAVQSAAVQSAVLQSAAPTPHALTPAPQGATQAAATTGSHMLDSAQLRVGENSSQLKISVQLPELGKVEVRAVSAHDVTTAYLTTFRHDALPALAEGRAGLEQALRSHDVVLGSLTSHAPNSQTQGQSGGDPHQQGQHPPAAPYARTSEMAETSIAASSTESSTTSLLPDYASISVLA